MIRDNLEKLLKKMFGAKARDTDPDAMTEFERREAENAAEVSGTHLNDTLANDSDVARREALHASQTKPPMADERVDESDAARRQALGANEKDGSHLESEPADDTEIAKEEIAFANPHDPPVGELVDDSDEAVYAAKRANEPAQKKGDEKEG